MKRTRWGRRVGALVLFLSAGCGGGGGGGTPAATPDATPPTVSLTAPAASARLTGVATLGASASDNVGVSRVEFYLDGVLKGTALTAPYTASLDTSTLNRGNYLVTAKAFDAAGNVGQAAGVAVTVPISTFITTQGTGGSTALATVYLAGVGAHEAHGLSLTVAGAHVASAVPSGVAVGAETLLVSGADVILGSTAGFGPGQVMQLSLDQVAQPAAIQVVLTQVLDATFSPMPLQ